MTRILACSDIHNNINAARQLRVHEGNDYDALIVAGDIGTHAASKIFDVLRTFQCPVLYVLGNWDHGISHHQDFGATCHHLHLSAFRVDSLSIIGESVDGIDPEWIAKQAEIEGTNQADLASVRQAYSERRRAMLSHIIANEDPAHTIFFGYPLQAHQNTTLPAGRTTLPLRP